MRMSPAGWRFEADEAAPERGLARAGFADEADALPGHNAQRYVPYRADRAASRADERLDERVDADERPFGFVPARRYRRRGERRRAQRIEFALNLVLADACCEPARIAGDQRRLAGAADRFRPVAAVGETAAVDHIGRARHGAPDRDEPRHANIGRRFRQQKPQGVRMERLPLDGSGVADFEQRAGVEHIDALAGREREPQVVGNEDEAHVSLALDTPQELDDLRLGRYVERRRGLVGDEQLRVASKSGGKCDALAHAARQLEWHAAGYILVDDADFREATFHLRRARGARGEFGPAAQHLVDVVAASHERIQHRERILHKHRHAKPADLAEFALGKPHQGDAVERDVACGIYARRQYAGDRPRGERFSGPRIRRRSRWSRPARRRCSRDVVMGTAPCEIASPSTLRSGLS